jgi:hypothetical protein
MSNEKDYEKNCNRCRQKILMSKRSNEWKAYDLTNGPHICQQKQESEIENKEIPQDREAKIAAIIKMIQSVVKELEDLKKQ